ncbi:uncharacterized protein inaF-D [Euwallacea fornicatus]|uniref:uncharacterized protein inaF-D n=1 Tax=Euwallacea fornicatus TaxID=995702 RepID=UPI00338E8942
MSYKSNGIKQQQSQQWKTASIMETPSVKFAGEEAKDRLYEPKHKKKLFRVLTVVAYVFFVSLAAIMLSLYYIFLWNGEQRVAGKIVTRQQLTGSVKCENVLAEIQRQIRLMDSQQQRLILSTTTPPPQTTSTAAPESTTWLDEDFSNLEDLRRNSGFFHKLVNDYVYGDAVD